VSDVVPVMGLLAETAATDRFTERDADALAALGRLDELDLEDALLSPQDLLDAEVEGVSRDQLRRLLGMLDLHGIAIGVGLALSLRLRASSARVVTLLGDGECQGGIVWEGAMAARKFRLARLTAILDANDVQLDGAVHDIMPLEPVVDKWRAFGWAVVEVNGHDVRQVLTALATAEQIHDRPTMIVARTTKGRGVSFMENDARWHGVAPNADQLAAALAELQGGA